MVGWDYTWIDVSSLTLDLEEGNVDQPLTSRNTMLIMHRVTKKLLPIPGPLFINFIIYHFFDKAGRRTFVGLLDARSLEDLCRQVRGAPEKKWRM